MTLLQYWQEGNNKSSLPAHKLAYMTSRLKAIGCHNSEDHNQNITLQSTLHALTSAGSWLRLIFFKHLQSQKVVAEESV